MSSLKKLICFLCLITGYVALISLLDLRLVLISRIYGHGPGFELFVLAAWYTCYGRGPYAGSALDPYPYRSTIIFTGILAMTVLLVLKIVVELY